MFDPNEVHVTLDTLVWRDNIAMAESRTSARMRNGKLYENRYCWSFEIASGHILHVREYFDTLHTASMV
jgi:ketosteroid isomerase-like protein